MAGQGSARVTLKEIDLSQVRDTEVLPQGVPAAVVGPAKRGPAFVPKTFANMQQFGEVFGSMQEVSKESNANRFAPLALNEWMRNAQAGTFIRTLGVGSAEGRMNRDKTVDGAGFVVGEKVSYDSTGKLQENQHAVISQGNEVGAEKAARTHFLGCFMQDTEGSTFLQDAGFQTDSASASFTITFAATAPDNSDFILVEAVNAAGDTKFFKFVFNTGNNAISNGGGDGLLASTPQVITLGVQAGNNHVDQFEKALKGLDENNDALGANPNPADYFADPVVNGLAITVRHVGAGESTNTGVEYLINSAAAGDVTITSGDVSKSNSLASQTETMTASGATVESAVIDFVQRPGTDGTPAQAEIAFDDQGGDIHTLGVRYGHILTLVNNSNPEITKKYVLVAAGNTAMNGLNEAASGDIIDGVVANGFNVAVGIPLRNEHIGGIAVVVNTLQGSDALFEELADVILSPNGHDGSIAAVVNTVGDVSTLTLTFADPGTTGNGKAAIFDHNQLTDVIVAGDQVLFANGTDDDRTKFTINPILGNSKTFRLNPSLAEGTVETPGGGVDFDIGILTSHSDNDLTAMRNTVSAAIQGRIDAAVFDDNQGDPVISVLNTDNDTLTLTSLLKGQIANHIAAEVSDVEDAITITRTAGQNGTKSAVTLTFTEPPAVGDSFTLTTIDPSNNSSSDMQFTFVADNNGNDNGVHNNGVISVETNPDLTTVLNRIQLAIEANDGNSIGTQYNSSPDLPNNSITITRNDDTPANNLGFVFDQSVTFSLRETATVQGASAQPVEGLFGEQTFTMQGGGGGAVPVIRGILMSPRGVVPSLQQTDGSYKDLASGVLTSTEVVDAAGVLSFGDNQAISGYEIGKVLSDGSQSFKILLNGYNGNDANVLDCSFDPENVNYFAKVLNTDPDQIESRGHYLHAHWDIDASVSVPSKQGIKKSDGTAATDNEVGFCIKSSGNPREAAANKPDFESFDTRFRTAHSPWVQSQGFGAGANKEVYDLFKLYALDDGEVANDRFRVLVSNIIAPENDGEWGSFDLSLESFYSDPIKGEALITWKRLSLDPDSKNFIGRVIGDKHMYYDFDRVTSRQRLVEEGDFEVKNNYVRVEVSELVKSKEIPSASLPCGFKSYRTLNTEFEDLFNEQGDENGANKLLAANIFDGLKVLPLPFVKTITRQSGDAFEASEALAWGVKFAKKQNAADNNELGEIRFNESMKSWTKFFPDMDGDNSFGKDSSEGFSLENIVVSDKDNIDWSTSEYARNGSHDTKQNIELSSAASVGRNVRYLKFRFMMQGGFDGLDIFNKEKAEMSTIAAHREANDENDNSVFTGATIQTYKRAIDVLADKSATELQLLAIPGMREPAVTDYAITACESRFDAMLVMDVEEIDRANEVIVDSSVKPSVTNIIRNFSNRELDTSFAAAYFPDVIMRRSSNGAPLQVPPSVGMLGVMSLNDTLADPWFAPAGLTRGRINALNAKVQMNRDVLNDLYDADINPIYEPAGRAGEVYAFGQKTLMQNQSALDRINVRRLLINLRRRVKNIANTLLFEPNRASTLARFSSLVEPIMAEVQARQGVERYKVQIDTTTTTQNDVENNTIRGKIYLQPTKSVEFISLDFVVTNSID